MDQAKHVNPYIAGAPVSGPEMFYGRDDVFSFIQRNLVGRHRDTPIVLYGQRRTGKTSVLYQLNRHLEAGYRCVFIDLHGLSLGSMSDFLLGVAGLVGRSLRRDFQIDVDLPGRSVFLADPRSAFEDVFLGGVLNTLGEDHLVLMLDEAIRLDEEVRAGRMDREVFEYMRHLMQHHPRLNFIFSLGSGLEEMRKDYAFMFSVSLYHRISFLEPSAASALITEPVREHFQVAPEAVEKILQVTSGHPYYTQLVCHCLFDLWSRSPKPTMTVADVYAILAEAIELGSANLTYVWEDSTPEEQAVMAGMAAAMRGGASEVTIGQVRDSWRRSDMSLPAQEVAGALRSLASREVITGDSAYSFAVDLQRLWLDKHRRLDWVKDELAEPIKRWERRARASRRGRYTAAMTVILLIAGYISAGAVAGLPPFPRHAAGPTPIQSLLAVMPGDLSNNPGECHTNVQQAPWQTTGSDVSMQCTDPGLPGGQVDGYHFASSANLNASWKSFNLWWGFNSGTTETRCPPVPNHYGSQAYGGLQIECGPSGNDTYSAWYAEYFAASNSLIVTQAAPHNDSYVTLAAWMSSPTSVQPTSAQPTSAPTALAVLRFAGTITVGQTPSYVQVAPNGKFAYIVNPGAGAITVLNTALDLVSGTIKIPQGPPQFVSFSPDSKTAYVSVYTTSGAVHLIAFVDTATGTVTATVPVNNFSPAASATSPDGRFLYVPNHNTAMTGANENVIDVIDIQSKKLIGTIPVPANPHWVVFDKKGHFYTTDMMSATVTVLNAQTNAIITEIQVGETPHSEAISPNGSRLAVASYSGNQVFLINTATDKQIAQIPVGHGPLDIAYSPDGRYLLTVNNLDNTVTVIDPTDNRVIGTIPTGRSPTSVAILPNGHQAYVTDEGDGTIEILNFAK